MPRRAIENGIIPSSMIPCDRRPAIIAPHPIPRALIRKIYPPLVASSIRCLILKAKILIWIKLPTNRKSADVMIIKVKCLDLFVIFNVTKGSKMASFGKGFPGCSTGVFSTPKAKADPIIDTARQNKPTRRKLPLPMSVRRAPKKVPIMTPP